MILIGLIVAPQIELVFVNLDGQMLKNTIAKVAHPLFYEIFLARKVDLQSPDAQCGLDAPEFDAFGPFLRRHLQPSLS